MFDVATEWFSAHKLFSSVILIAAYLLLRWMSNRFLRGEDEFVNEERRRLLSYVRNGLVLLLVLGLAMVWAPALRVFALSITAFLVALVLATKELILCVTGGLLRTAAGAFSVGDWIRVGQHRGEVVDQSFLSVTLQELEAGPHSHEFTGRTITLPNSLFLSTPAINEHFYKRYVYHPVEITLQEGDDPMSTARLMERTMAEAAADSEEVARRYAALIRREAGVAMPPINPTARLTTSAEGRTRITVTGFLPTGEVDRIEKAVMEATVTELYRGREARAAQKLAAAAQPVPDRATPPATP